MPAAAAALVTAGVRRLRAAVPVLPESWTDEAVVARLIRALAERGNGTALLVDGRLAGFQAATLIDGHGGSLGVHARHRACGTGEWGSADRSTSIEPSSGATRRSPSAGSARPASSTS